MIVIAKKKSTTKVIEIIATIRTAVIPFKSHCPEPRTVPGRIQNHCRVQCGRTFQTAQA